MLKPQAKPKREIPAGLSIMAMFMRLAHLCPDAYLDRVHNHRRAGLVVICAFFPYPDPPANDRAVHQGDLNFGGLFITTDVAVSRADAAGSPGFILWQALILPKAGWLA